MYVSQQCSTQRASSQSVVSLAHGATNSTRYMMVKLLNKHLIINREKRSCNTVSQEIDDAGKAQQRQKARKLLDTKYVE